MPTSIALNARHFSHSGESSAYSREMATQLKDLLKVVQPGNSLKGLEGHLWEQMYLPAASAGRLLWSPHGTGPISVGRQVCTIHDLSAVEHPEWFPSGAVKWSRWLLPKLVSRVQHIITVSEFTKARLVDYFRVNPGKISVIPNGVDSSFRPRGVREIEQLRFESGMRGARYILSVSSSGPRGNLARLLAAWERLLPELPRDIELVVAGADYGAQNIPTRVRFISQVKPQHMPALYSGALALVYPSLYDGFGVPVLEAMACGCAVVAANTTAIPELAGDAAILVDPSDEESIADAMFRMVMRPQLREGLARKAFARAERLSWEATAAKTRAVLMEQSAA